MALDKTRYAQLKEMAINSDIERQLYGDEDDGHEYKHFWVCAEPTVKPSFTSDEQVDEWKTANREASRERIAERQAKGESIGYGKIGTKKTA